MTSSISCIYVPKVRMGAFIFFTMITYIIALVGRL